MQFFIVCCALSPFGSFFQFAEEKRFMNSGRRSFPLHFRLMMVFNRLAMVLNPWYGTFSPISGKS